MKILDEAQPPKVCLWVGSGKFLGFLVNQREIEANPEKINALLGMSSPIKPKKVMSLADILAALSQFV